MTAVSDERLEELIRNFERRATAKWLADNPSRKQECEDLGAALRGYQALLKAVREHNENLGPRVCQGWIEVPT